MAPYRKLLTKNGRMAAMALGSPADLAYLLASGVYGSRRVRFVQSPATAPGLIGKGDVMSQLNGKVAVITGAASGVGLAAAALFAGEGARVYAAGHPARQLRDSLVRTVGDVTPVDCDPADPEGLDRLAEAVRSGTGRADVLYAAAGTGVPRVPPR